MPTKKQTILIKVITEVKVVLPLSHETISSFLYSVNITSKFPTFELYWGNIFRDRLLVFPENKKAPEIGSIINNGILQNQQKNTLMTE